MTLRDRGTKLRDGKGRTVVLGAELGRGGEASVYAVSSEPRLAAKIFHTHSTERVEKLRTMIAHPPTDPTERLGHVSICWPSRLLFNEAQACVGFAMPILDRAKHKSMLHFYNALDRRQHAPMFTWDYLVRAAQNIAVVVQSIHARGYVIGDLNESNLFISDQALVTLIDCDSMQVRTPTEVFHCTVAKGEYLAPEMQGRDLSKTDRTVESDNFALAVLLFLMLMEGVHPYSGLWKGGGEPPTLEGRIRVGACPYVGSALATPMPGAPPFELLPASLRALFARAFGQGFAQPTARPTAREWQEALAQVELVTCKVNRQHRYAKGVERCPWCERRARFGFDAFPDPRAAEVAAPLQQPLKARPFSRVGAPAPAPVPPPRQRMAWTQVRGAKRTAGPSVPPRTQRATLLGGLLQRGPVGGGRIAMLTWTVPLVSAAIALLLYVLYPAAGRFQFFWALWMFSGLVGLLLHMWRGRLGRCLVSLLIVSVAGSTLWYGAGLLVAAQSVPLLAVVPAWLGSRSLLLLARHWLETAALLGRFARAAILVGLVATTLPSGVAAATVSLRESGLTTQAIRAVGLSGPQRGPTRVELQACARVTRSCGCESRGRFHQDEPVQLLLKSPGRPVVSVSVTWPGGVAESIEVPAQWNAGAGDYCKVARVRVPAMATPAYARVRLSVGAPPHVETTETGFSVIR